MIEVENHVFATSQISQTTLRSVLGQKDLDELLTNREEINEELQSIIDEQTDPWGGLQPAGPRGGLAPYTSG